MNSTLILPTETCVTSDVLKRALLNYDKVFLKNPADRDFVGGGDVLGLMSGLRVGFTWGQDAAKPLGKEKDHDVKFKKILQEFKLAIDEGSLVVMGMPDGIYNPSNSISLLHSVPPINAFVYNNYRKMLAEEDFIQAASRGINRDWLNDNDYDELAPKGVEDTAYRTDGAPDNKKIYTGRVRSDEERVVLTRMIYARIASMARNLVLCDVHGLAPFTTNIGYSAVLQKLQSNFSNLVAEVFEGTRDIDDLDLIGKSEKVAFSDFLNQDKINYLTVKQVLKLRTRLWGRYNENKTELEKYLISVALESKDVDEFSKKVKAQFEKLLKDSRDYIHERNTLGIKIALTVAAAASPFVTSPIPISSAIEQSFTTAPFGLLMALATPASLLMLEKKIPEIRKVLKQQKDLTKLPSYSLYNYFKPIL